MVEPSPTRKRSPQASESPASLILLMDEYFERLKLIAHGKFYARTLFLLLLSALLAYELTRPIGPIELFPSNLTIRLTFVFIAMLLGSFWYVDEFVHIASMRRIADTVAMITNERESQRAYEKRAYEKWDNRYIRFHYERLYGQKSFIVSRLEPVIWTAVVFYIELMTIYLSVSK